MVYKDPDRLKRFRREHSIKRADYIRSRKSGGCVVCGETEVCCLDFHHINQDNKEYQVTHMRTHSIKSIEREIEKCVVLCRNCHIKVHMRLVDLHGVYGEDG